MYIGFSVFYDVITMMDGFKCLGKNQKVGLDTFSRKYMLYLSGRMIRNRRMPIIAYFINECYTLSLKRKATPITEWCLLGCYAVWLL
jgi:hypothetical protein